MKRIKMKRWLCAALIAGMLATNGTAALAAEPETGTEGTEELIPEIDQGLKANSFRYQDGQPVRQEAEGTRDLNTEAYHENATRKGIDVSEWQGEIDWEQVKESGIDFAILRVGYGGDDERQDDKYFERNVSECERLGIPYGVYIYSYATNTERARSEAAHVLRLVEGHHLAYPIFFDMEDNSTLVRNPVSNGVDIQATQKRLAEIAETFCAAIEEAGYPVGVYANLSWLNEYLTAECFSRWYTWVAQWNTTCTYTGDYTLWQYSDTGEVPGIAGRVDMNYLIGYPEDHGVPYQGKYQDLTGDEWFIGAVDLMMEAGVMDGLSETVFGPYEELTRSQTVTSLWQIEGKPRATDASRFPDVSAGESYTDAVLWASENGIVNGYSNGNFGPDDTVTREQLAKIVYNYVTYKGCLTTDKADLSGYQDAGWVSDFAADAMAWIVGRGLIKGKEDGARLDPQGTTSRAEYAVLLQRFLEPFADVPYNAWYAKDVALVYLSSLMTGTEDNIFSAGDNLARAQFATILYRMSGEPAVTYQEIFPDVPEGEWYTNAVTWANENGVITGYEATGTFGPGDSINREQLATMLYRYASLTGCDVSEKADLSIYPDNAAVNAFAREAMAWCVDKGIITGDNGNLSPQKNASRAECATMLMRYLRAVR